MTLSWPERAKKAIAVFFRQWNDIDVFIEDTSPCTIKVYEELLNRLAGGIFKIGKVIPLGNRAQVIQSCMQDQANRGRPRMYIIDGDFDLLLGITAPDLKHLFRHDVYCIENHLIDESALIEILHEEDSSTDRAGLARRLNYSDWISCECDALLYLFLMYALFFKFLPEVQTVGTPINKYITGGKRPYVDPDKVANRVHDMYINLIEIYDENRIIKELIDAYERVLNDNNILNFISGKDYLFPAISFRMRNISKFSVTNDSLKIRLAKICDLDVMENLKVRLIEELMQPA